MVSVPHGPETPTETDVVVIGGGPAGSTVSTLLARAGVNVTLFEKAQFPRAHVGESLLPATLAVLDDIGVLDDVQRAGFVKKPGATMCWGRTAEPWSWYFKETNRRFPHAYQVWRPTFDQILLDHSARTGVAVHQGMEVRGAEFKDDGAVVHLADGRRVAARLVIDASGQTSVLARQLKLKVWDAEFRNLAVYGYFDDCPHLPPPDQGNILIESCPDGWLWKIPLAGGVSSIGAVVDRDFGAEAIKAHGSTAMLMAQIAASNNVSELVGDRMPRAKPSVVRDWSYSTTHMVGKGFMLIGDAACFVDPLFSTGVHLAITAAHLAAAHVVTMLTDPDLAAESAQAFERAYRTQYEHFHELARLFYASNRSVDSYFWEARRLTGASAPPREAFVRAVSGQAAAGYERAVLSRGALPDAFHHMLDAVAPQPPPADVAGLRLRLADGHSLVSTAILAADRFERGYALRADRRVDVPLSPLVAHLVDRVGANAERRTIGELAASVIAHNQLPEARAKPALMAAARLLAQDGIFVPASA